MLLLVGGLLDGNMIGLLAIEFLSLIIFSKKAGLPVFCVKLGSSFTTGVVSAIGFPVVVAPAVNSSGSCLTRIDSFFSRFSRGLL